MAYASADARREMLDDIAGAIDRLGVAVAALGEAYELLDENAAERMEIDLFGPVQAAYGRAQRTHSGFAERHGLPGARFAPATPPHPSTGVRGMIDVAVGSALAADAAIAELQDSLRPVDVGDAELREGLADVRRRLDGISGVARRFVSVLGR